MNCTNAIIVLTLLFFVGFNSQAVVADIAVIVNQSNQSKLTEKVVKRIFLDQRKTFSNGEKVNPVDQPEDSLIRQVFTKRIIKKNKKSLKKYWSRQIFNGKASPPPVMKDDASVKAHVASLPGGIGYIDQVNVDDSVKVAFTFK